MTNFMEFLQSTDRVEIQSSQNDNSDKQNMVSSDEESSSLDNNLVIVEQQSIPPHDELGEKDKEDPIVVDELAGLNRDEEFQHEIIKPVDESTITVNSSLGDSASSGAARNDFIKVKEPGTHDPPHYTMIPFCDILSEEDNNKPSLKSLTRAVIQAFSFNDNMSSGESLVLCYHDSTGDLVTISSDSILRKALEENSLKISIHSKSTPLKYPTDFSVKLIATWQEDCEICLSSRRLFAHEEGQLEDGPQFIKLVEYAASQFGQPASSLSMIAVLDDKDKTKEQRIACDEDLMDACQSLAENGQITVNVTLVSARFVRVSYPTYDDDTLSRRVTVQSLVDKKSRKVSYNKLLVSVAQSLGTEEFVLTYTIPGESSKYFLTCADDFMDALSAFPAGELVLVPQIPEHKAEGEETDEIGEQHNVPNIVSQDSQEHHLNLVHARLENKHAPVLRLSLQGREAAYVEHSLDCLFPSGTHVKEARKASYWKLLHVVMESFCLSNSAPGRYPPVCLFYVAQDGSKAEVTGDAYLNELVEPRLKRPSDFTEFHIRVEPVAFSLSTHRTGVSLRNFALSHVMYNEGLGVSCSKVIRLARLVDPVVGLTYQDLSGQRTPILTDHDLANAFQQYPMGDLLIRTRIQDNPFHLMVRDASLLGKKCKFGSWTTPNIMFRSNSAMCMWDISVLVPGFYRVSTSYWRDLNLGPVSLSFGFVDDIDLKTAVRNLTDLKVRANVLSQVELQPTGLGESDFSKTSFGNFSFRPTEGLTPFFVVAAFQAGIQTPDIFVSNVELTYLGPAE